MQNKAIMDGRSGTARDAVGVVRIETGAGESRIVEPAREGWVPSPDLAVGAIATGLAIAGLGAWWLRRRPRVEPTREEVFERVASAIGASSTLRKESLELSKRASDGVPSAVGLLLSASARARLRTKAAAGVTD